MTISIIAAIGNQNQLGLNGDIPWNLPNDLQLFKMLTYGSTIIMGRKTWESIGSKPLPGRRNIVITSQDLYAVESYPTLDDAISVERDYCGLKNIFVIGGAMLYNDSLPIADRMYITRVNYNDAADVYFPEFNISEWKVKATVEHPLCRTERGDIDPCGAPITKLYERKK